MYRSIVYEDKVYILGGYDGTSRLRSVECFTPGPPGTRLRWHQVRLQTVGQLFQRKLRWPICWSLDPTSLWLSSTTVSW